jgi:hypothetical protein
MTTAMAMMTSQRTHPIATVPFPARTATNLACPLSARNQCASFAVQRWEIPYRQNSTRAREVAQLWEKASVGKDRGRLC